MTTPGMVFPGQGSQHQGMLEDFADNFPRILHTYEEAADILGFDLWRIQQENPNDQLNQTEFTQPILLTASVAIWRLLKREAVSSPSMMAGHSLGEYSALVCADALSFADALMLVRLRGQYMQAAVPEGEGAMAAILGLSLLEVNALCEAVANGEVLAAANINCPGQIVIAGSQVAVAAACEQAKAHGAKLAKMLPVSVPSHCALMAPAAHELAQALQDISLRTPSIPVVQNVDGKVTTEVTVIRDNLIQQLTHPVQWVACVETMLQAGCDVFVECGAGKVLTGLTKRISKSVACFSTEHAAAFAWTVQSI